VTGGGVFLAKTLIEIYLQGHGRSAWASSTPGSGPPGSHVFQSAPRIRSGQLGKFGATRNRAKNLALDNRNCWARAGHPGSRAARRPLSARLRVEYMGLVVEGPQPGAKAPSTKGKSGLRFKVAIGFHCRSTVLALALRSRQQEFRAAPARGPSSNGKKPKEADRRPRRPFQTYAGRKSSSSQRRHQAGRQSGGTARGPKLQTASNGPMIADLMLTRGAGGGVGCGPPSTVRADRTGLMGRDDFRRDRLNPTGARSRPWWCGIDRMVPELAALWRPRSVRVATQKEKTAGEGKQTFELTSAPGRGKISFGRGAVHKRPPLSSA